MHSLNLPRYKFHKEFHVYCFWFASNGDPYRHETSTSQVLCLDECAANIDTETATILQSAISSECTGVTVITIAHRISTIFKMDNVLILSGGCLVYIHSIFFLGYT